jgi:hypothetical protein
MGHTRLVHEPSPKAVWAERLPHGESMKQSPGRLIETDDDPAEVEYYEAAADPTFVQLERDQRRFRAMLHRRLRRR